MRRVFLLLAVAAAMTTTMVPVPAFAQTGGGHCEDNTLPNGDLNVVCVVEAVAVLAALVGLSSAMAAVYTKLSILVKK